MFLQTFVCTRYLIAILDSVLLIKDVKVTTDPTRKSWFCGKNVNNLVYSDPTSTSPLLFAFIFATGSSQQCNKPLLI